MLRVRIFTLHDRKMIEVPWQYKNIYFKMLLHNIASCVDKHLFNVYTVKNVSILFSFTTQCLNFYNFNQRVDVLYSGGKQSSYKETRSKD